MHLIQSNTHFWAFRINFFFWRKTCFFWDATQHLHPPLQREPKLRFKKKTNIFFPQLRAQKINHPVFPANLTECLLSFSPFVDRLKCLLLRDVVWSVTPSLRGLVWPQPPEAGVCLRAVEVFVVYLCGLVWVGLSRCSSGFRPGIMDLLISFHLSQYFHRSGLGKKPGLLAFVAVPQDQFLIYWQYS